ncbi:hypothetical protein KQH40_00485 [bacterium]|nr:hypothetical protein [bacterium]
MTTHRASQRLSINTNRGKQRYAIAIRKPAQMPDAEIIIPPPSRAPSSPPQINLLILILPSALLLLGALATALLSDRGIVAVVAMMGTSIGYPIANLISINIQKKKYIKNIEEREVNYKKTLKKIESQLDQLVHEQRQVAEFSYPDENVTLEIGMKRGEDERLWWRRLRDSDFLSLCLGRGEVQTSFKVLPPNITDPDEPLLKYANNLMHRYDAISNLPKLMSLRRAGSVVVSGSTTARYRFTRRLLADVMVHHSPEDVGIIVLSDLTDAGVRWEWLKWAPHTKPLDSESNESTLFFTEDQIASVVTELKNHLDEHLSKSSFQRDDEVYQGYSLIVVCDDSGKIRQLADFANLAAYGQECGIYTIFVGERGVPNSCRASIEINESGRFEYKEAWEAHIEKFNMSGEASFLTGEQCELLARKLSGLGVATGKSNYSLPSLVRLSSILGGEDPLNKESIKNNWNTHQHSNEQALLPIGQYIDQTGLRTMHLDFRPTERGGKAEYHALLIGTTGSGKSVFLQSMVLAAAHSYSPDTVNFLLMDFKAGPSELKRIKELPHVVGMVTDLDALLADRALQALEMELTRRQFAFDSEEDVIDIWDFNHRYREKAFPHLMVVIDEFAKGAEVLPDLVSRLRDLGRRGRSFGIYFILANQEIDSRGYVDSLLSNVGWYVVLRVKRDDEMRLIERGMKKLDRGNGRGYIRVGKDITLFQGAFAGMPAITDSSLDLDEYVVYKILPDGGLKEFYKHEPQKDSDVPKGLLYEIDVVMDQIEVAVNEMGIERPQPIYMNPIPAEISLTDVFTNFEYYRLYYRGGWSDVKNGDNRLKVPIGMIDIPQKRQQPRLIVDFNDADGNLRLVGNPGNMAISSILYSLAFTHRPDEVQFYILDYSADGALRYFISLPHTGAVIRLKEAERLKRLIDYFSSEIEKRSEVDWRGEGYPELFLVINNYAELVGHYEALSQKIETFVRGKAAGIHVIIATAQSSELNYKVAGNIANFITLHLATQDEYSRVLGRAAYSLPPLTQKSPGRGFYPGKDCANECQIVNSDFDPELLAHNTILAKEVKKNASIQDLVSEMRVEWGNDREKLPVEIEVLPNTIPFTTFVEKVSKNTGNDRLVSLPVGISYEDLATVQFDWANEINTWIVMGRRSSGKSNALMSIAAGVLYANPGAIECVAFAHQRSPFVKISSKMPVRVLSDSSEIIDECKRIKSFAKDTLRKKYLLLIDDLDALVDPSSFELEQAINSISPIFDNLPNTFLAASGMYDLLKNRLSSEVVKLLKRNSTGVVLSMDMAFDWLGVGLPPVEYRSMNLPSGRGFLLRGSNKQLVHLPWLDEGKQYIE